ncbi:undecaprenyl-phosphate glucose phosphotransferase [Allofournierella massiliensis]|uniref:undecaprenyl-phosphate glucose phosphotransferase n=1 Tax=Allofournierella massiliensis TaxID=1650663 RepID=UPI0039A02660
MIRKNQRLLNIVNCLLDIFLIALAYLLAVWLWLGVYRNNLLNPAVVLLQNGAIFPALLYGVFMAAIYYAFKLYGSFRFSTLLDETIALLKANLLGLLLIGMTLYLTRAVDFSRGVLVLFYVFSTGLVVLKRVTVRHFLRHFRMLGYNLKHVLIVGNGRLAFEYVDSLRRNPQYGYNVLGYVASSEKQSLGQYLGRYEDLPDLLAGPAVDEVIVALEPHETQFMNTIIASCEKQGAKIRIIPFYNDYIPSRPTVDVIGSVKLISIRTIPLDNMLNAALKRGMDIVGSLVLIVLTSPIMLIAAIGVKLSSPGPILFRQQRVGLNKKLFTMYKFRSMRVNASQDTGWSQNSDPRKTWFGSLIRKCSIDELPQFFNVLKGDMSLIGPRPEIPHFVEQFKETVPLYMVKHQVRPGITGWAQVKGFRGDTSIEGRIQCDIWYIENWSIFLDIKILFMTIFGGLFNTEKLEPAHAAQPPENEQAGAEPPQEKTE